MSGHGDRVDVRALGRWVAEARVDQAIEERRRERWLKQQATEESTLAGVLLDLAERGEAVVFTVGGSTLRAVVTLVGDDYAALTSETADVLVALAALDFVRVPAAAPVAGDRPERLTSQLADVLSTMAADRPQVSILTRQGTRVVGRLGSAGIDVAVVRLDSTSGDLAYVPVGAIATITLR